MVAMPPGRFDSRRKRAGGAGGRGGAHGPNGTLKPAAALPSRRCSMETVDQVEVSANVIAVSAVAPAIARPPRATSAGRLAKRLGLRLITADELTIRRRRCGQGFSF